MVSPEQLGEQYLIVYHRMRRVVAAEQVTRPG